MPKTPSWLFNEKKPVGIDYLDQKVAGEYDDRHGFRNFKKESDDIFGALRLSPASIMLDIGCGTGGLSIQFAERCKHVYAVDVSGAMIAVLERKIASQGIGNISAITAGLLDYRHSGEPLDAIVCNVALHHLPDFWKQIALINFYKMLKHDGKLFLGDVVFGFRPGEYQEKIDEWLLKMKEVAGEKMADETIVHIRDEYSTWDWVMTGMLERAGFAIMGNNEIIPNMRIFICSKLKNG